MSDEAKCSGSEASSPTKQSAQQPHSLIAYVHNLSPIRRNRENTKHYSTLTLQTSSGRNEQALLFSKHKRKLLQDHETSRIPVKFQKLAKTKNGKKLIINEITEITAPRPEEWVRVKRGYGRTDGWTDGDGVYKTLFEPFQVISAFYPKG